MTTGWVLLGAVVVVALWAIWAYNRFVTLTNRCEEGWSDIDVQLKRRYDLIPNLIESVKGYVQHERSTLEAVIAARAEASKVHVDASNITADGVMAMAAAEGALSSSLGKIFALAEAYPDLKANQNFVELQRELADTENKLQAARRFYNGNARDFKIALQSFPANMIGSLFSFKEEPFFELPESSVERETVKVSF